MPKFNINNYVSVTLTEYGAKIYNSQWDGLSIPKEYIPEQKKAGDTLKIQMWCLLETFGKHISIGFNSPFENCSMTFDEKDFEDD